MTRVAFPARCTVSVICGEHLVSQVYPAAVPVEAFIDGIVELLSDDLRRRGSDGIDATIGYELHRANGTRLDVTKTLDDLGIEDGATLVLAPARDGDSFEPQYESLSTGLARVGRRLFGPVTALTAMHTALGILGMIVLTITALAVYSRTVIESWVSSCITGLIGLALAIGAVSVWRWWPDRTDLLGVLGWLCVPPLAISFALAAPGELSAAHLFIAALTTVVAAVGAAAITRQHVIFAAAAVTTSAFVTVVAAVRMTGPVPWQWLGMSVMIALLALLTAAPTLALWAARIRPPHFGSITGRDLFQRGDGMPIDAVTPVEDDLDEESGRDSTPAGVMIVAAATRANAALTGICIAAAAMLPMSVWATVIPGQPRSGAAAALALLFVLIFISRARAFTDRRQAVPLVCGASAAVCAGTLRYVLHSHGSLSALVWGACVLSIFAAVGLAAALLVPVTRFTPLVRMTVEWLELFAIVTVMPLAAWISGLFTWVRMR